MTGHIKVGGVWKDLDSASVKVGGAWKEVTNGYTKIAGAWKEWFSASSPAMDLVQSQTLTSSTTSITFTGLGSLTDYKHLQIRTHAQMSDDNDYPRVLGIRINGISSTQYARHSLGGNGSSVFFSGETDKNSVEFPDCVPGKQTAASFGPGVFDILDFSSSVKVPTIRGLYGNRTPVWSRVYLGTGLHTTAQAITSLTIICPVAFTVGSRFSLYGIRGA